MGEVEGGGAEKELSVSAFFLHSYIHRGREGLSHPDPDLGFVPDEGQKRRKT